MGNVERQIDALIAREGGYVNHPADRGGPTRWGITQAVARENGYAGAMSAFPREKAVEIYRKLYWTRPRFDQVDARYPRLAAELFDTGVNMGAAVAAGFLQRALNALNSNAKHFADIAVDHQIGARTLGALDGYKTRRGAAGETVLLKAVECLQGERYIRLAEQRPANEAFVYGWLDHRIGNEG